MMGMRIRDALSREMDGWFCSLSLAGLVSFLRCSEFISETDGGLYSFLDFWGVRCECLDFGISLSCAVYPFSYVSGFGFLLNRRGILEGDGGFFSIFFFWWAFCSGDF